MKQKIWLTLITCLAYRYPYVGMAKENEARL